MKKILLTTLTAVMLLIACSRVPVTGRKQLKLVPESTLVGMSLDQYNQFLKQNQVVTNTSESRMVKAVGNKIAAATETYLKSHGYSDRLDDFKNWEFNLIQDKTANAFAMPGGKVIIFTGMMDITQTEAGLATVMGHEIAHVVARHGNERVSQGLSAQLGGVALDVALQDKPQETRNLFMTAYGLGAQLGVLLPFSRTHESEADKIGMVLMAIAGYEPAEAIEFWKRMKAAAPGGAAPPEFLSTHPHHDTRIQNLEQFLPTAQRFYKKYN